ncbi:MAG: lytic transglycosylase domain-containing protein [Pseudomonadota bacterium]
MRLLMFFLFVLFVPIYPALAEDNFNRAVQALREGKVDYGASLVRHNAVASDVYTWLHIMQRPDDFGYDQIIAFMQRHDTWPEQSELQRAAEKHLQGVGDAQIMAFYQSRKPLSAAGMDAYLGALTRAGQAGQVAAVLGPWWNKTLLKTEDQARIFQKYAKSLPRTQHLQRLNVLVLNDYGQTAMQLATAIGGGLPELVQARLALTKGAGNADSLISRVPAGLQDDPGLLLDRVRWRRKSDATDGAMALLDRQPRLSEYDNAEGWWQERQIIVRRLLERRDYAKAYRLASKHGLPTAAERAEAEWLSGWIALRFLGRPADAFTHFEAMYKDVSSPISKARGAYWAGRAAGQADQMPVATAWYQVAAKYPQTYYGQHANRALDAGLRQSIPSRVNVPGGLLTQVRQSNQGQAAQLLAQAGMTREAYQFLRAIADQATTRDEYAAVADFTQSTLGLKPQALRLAKRAAQEKGFYLPQYAYPTLSKTPQTGDMDRSIVLAVIRQESEFDPTAVSPVGARGLMQLMPRTAQETARKMGISHSEAMLTSQPYHNVRLGSAYLTGLMGRFDGAYPLVYAAYNAGGSRVAQWLETYGDPRQGEIDWIDWIELIPYTETRNYVQRVMEGSEIYKAR